MHANSLAFQESQFHFSSIKNSRWLMTLFYRLPVCLPIAIALNSTLSVCQQDQQSNAFATAAQRQYEQSCAPVLAAIRIAHQRPGAVINLALLAQSCLDDRFCRPRKGSTQRAHEALHALIAARETVTVNQILPNAHRVPATPKLELDHFPIRFTGTG